MGTSDRAIHPYVLAVPDVLVGGVHCCVLRPIDYRNVAWSKLLLDSRPLANTLHGSP